LGIQEMRLRAVAADTPQELTLRELIDQGPGKNAHVILKDFRFGQNYVYEEKSRSKTWTKAWVPLIPLDGPIGKINLNPTSFQVILKCMNVKSENDLATLALQPTIKGMVINEIDSLGSKEKDHLTKSYPNTNFTRCWIVEPDREPAGPVKLMLFLGGGGGALAAGMLLIILNITRKKRAQRREAEDQYHAGEPDRS
jgi:hypothetical protein